MLKYSSEFKNLNAKWIREKRSYLLEFVKSIVRPFFRHEIVGEGEPLGGPHSRVAVSPGTIGLH